MPQGLKNLSKNAKIAIGAGAGALVILLGALAVWQPWQQPQDQAGDNLSQQDQGQTPDNSDQETSPVTLRVGTEDLPCTIYDGDGWELYIPEDWQPAEDNAGDKALFSSSDGATLSVRTSSADPAGSSYAVISKSAGSDASLTRRFYVSREEGCWELSMAGPESAWESLDKLSRAIARTAMVDGEVPFQTWSPMPSEPDWQVAEGDTILFLDKDGVGLDTAAEQAVRNRMISWTTEQKAAFTGEYDYTLTWCASYTKLGNHSYVDLFRAEVSYPLKDGAGTEGLPAGTVEDGRLHDAGTLYIAVSHNGSQASAPVTFWDGENQPGDVLFTQILIDALS